MNAECYKETAIIITISLYELILLYFPHTQDNRILNRNNDNVYYIFIFIVECILWFCVQFVTRLKFVM